MRVTVPIGIIPDCDSVVFDVIFNSEVSIMQSTKGYMETEYSAEIVKQVKATVIRISGLDRVL